MAGVLMSGFILYKAEVVFLDASKSGLDCRIIRCAESSSLSVKQSTSEKGQSSSSTELV